MNLLYAFEKSELWPGTYFTKNTFINIMQPLLLILFLDSTEAHDRLKALVSLKFCRDAAWWKPISLYRLSKKAKLQNPRKALHT
jgi:hypothetical protein